MDNERPPGGNLELGVVVQHVAPGTFQGGLEGVLWQHCIYILHCKVGRAQDVCRAVHRHDGQREVTAGLERRLENHHKNNIGHFIIISKEGLMKNRMVQYKGI